VQPLRNIAIATRCAVWTVLASAVLSARPAYADEVSAATPPTEAAETTETAPQLPPPDAIELRWYGMVNKELRWIQQTHPGTEGRFTSGTEVDGGESRFGVKAQLGPWHAKIELGVNASLDRPDEDGNFARLQVRHASLGWSDPRFGAFLVGRDWLPASLEMFRIDPLLPSGFESYGLDIIRQVRGYRGAVGLGYVVHAPTAQLSYRSPALFGCTLAATYARNDTGLLGDGDHAEQSYTAAWSGDIGVLDARLGGSYGSAVDCADGWRCPKIERAYWQGFATLAWRGARVNAAYGRETTPTDRLRRLFLSADYARERGRFALSYSRVRYRQYSGVDAQWAGGYYHTLWPDHVEARALVGVIDIDGDGTQIGSDASGAAVTQNLAYVATLGTVLSF